MGQIISKYVIYYQKNPPKLLTDFILQDHNILLVKNGLGEIKGLKCPKLALHVHSINSRIDNQRIIAINNLLKLLMNDGSVEHFVKI